MIGVWDNHLAVIDYKTSKYEKDQASIRSYFMQGSAYAQMYYEVYGQLPTKVVIIMAVQNGPSTYYIEDVEPNLIEFRKLRESVDA